MGRDLRVIDPDGIYHAVSCGNNDGPIAWDRVDRASLRKELGAAATRHGWEVFAWCALTTHHHVLLRAPKGGFSDGFREINGNHSRRTNRRHGRKHHLFCNRPFSLEVTSDAHLVAAVLYVVRNPVAAGICRDAGAWADSSYRATVGMEPPPPWLAIDSVLPLFGRAPDEARREFARLVHGGPLPVSDTGSEEPPALRP
jgi:putative transposase